MFCLYGSLKQEGEFWAIEVPLLNIYTQGKDRDDAYRMLKDAMETLAEEKDFYELETDPELYENVEYFAVHPTEDMMPLLTFFTKALTSIFEGALRGECRIL